VIIEPGGQNLSRLGETLAQLALRPRAILDHLAGQLAWGIEHASEAYASSTPAGH